jgi:hypothetical protein
MKRSHKLGCICAVILLLLPLHIFASTTTTSDKGIHSDSLTLPGDTPGSTGSPLQGLDVKIGQVEEGRPAINGTDGTANLDVNPTAVTLLDGQGITANLDLGNGHAERVASVMISTDFTDSNANGDAPGGVAYGASLYSSAYLTVGGTPVAYQDAIVTMQYVSGLPNIRAVNNSWGKPKEQSTDVLDGNSLLTSAFDWLGNKYPNVLQVTAGNEDAGGNPLPTDNFNGMTIGSLAKQSDGVYRLVSSHNLYDEDAVGDRTSISLLAPGDLVETGNLVTPETVSTGTSYATPHVTGTGALLQQFAENRITKLGSPQWTANARRHEVMKAVLINSADKIKDTGNGDFLGMEKTVEDVDGSTWLSSNAYFDDTIPLDLRMGAGALNSKRALQQFRNGQFTHDASPVPAIGWDLGTTIGDDGVNKYVLSQPLRANSFVSITLAWDRKVLFDVNPDMDDQYE